MGFRKVGVTVLVTFLAGVSVSSSSSLPTNQSEADSLLNPCRKQLQTNEFEVALQTCQKALDTYRATQNRLGEAKALTNLGLAYNGLKNYTKAIEYFQKSLIIARKIHERELEKQTLVKLGYALLKQGLQHSEIRKFDTALSFLQEALIIFQLTGERLGKAVCIINIGLAYNNLENYSKAIEYLQNSLVLLREMPDRESERTVIKNLGYAFLQQGIQQAELRQFEIALQSLQQALSNFHKIGDREGEALSIGNLGLTYDSLRQYKRAIDFYQRHLSIARETGDRLGEAKSLNNLGNVYVDLDRYEQAIKFFQQSLAIARAIGDRQEEASSLINLGISFDLLGQYKQAIKFYQQSLTIARAISNREKEAKNLNGLGQVYRILGQYEEAISLHQQSLVIFREIRDRMGESHSLDSLGLVYRNLGQYEQAIKFHQQSLTIARTIGDRAEEAGILSNLGLVYDSLEYYDKAIDSYQQSLAIAKEINDRLAEGNALGNLGRVYLGAGQPKQAIEFLTQQLQIVREIADRRGEGNALGNMGIAYNDLGQYKQAINFSQQWLVIAKKINDRYGEGASLSNLGLALLESGNIIEAEKTLKSAIEVWESIRNLVKTDLNKVSIFDIQSDAYINLQEVLTIQNKTNEALETAERSRARAFVDLLTRRLSPQLEAQPRISYPTYGEIKQIAQKQNATIVQYSIIYSKKVYIWVVKPTGEVVFRQVDLKQLQQQNRNITTLVPRIRNAIGVRSGSNTNEIAFKPGDRIHFKTDKPNTEPWEVVSFDPQNGILMVRHPSFATTSVIPKSINDVEDFGQTSLQQLHQILIEPIADLLPKNASDRVIFIPQGELFLVPFPALQDKEGKYLIEKHTILTAPSIQVLDLTRKQRQRLANSTAKDVLVVGNPSPMPAPFQPLEYAEPEAKAIANLLNTKAITGTQATESAIVAQMSNAKMIHLATHGQFDDIRGLGSAIALAPSGKDDGLLTAEEILNLKLNAELVVLSACDTGRGRLTGDGVIGLSRSLISAGVPSVIVSLWKVPDNTTSGLMVEFYRQLKVNPDKAQALRQAMLTTMKQHPNPRDWAAFTLIGEAQ